jgi:hypothetical protein
MTQEQFARLVDACIEHGMRRGDGEDFVTAHCEEIERLLGREIEWTIIRILKG